MHQLSRAFTSRQCLLNEEKFLRRDLPGYAEYCQRTRYRLVPFAWQDRSRINRQGAKDAKGSATNEHRFSQMSLSAFQLCPSMARGQPKAEQKKMYQQMRLNNRLMFK